MSIHYKPRIAALAIIAVAAIACGPSRDTQRRTESAVAAATKTQVATQAGEVMAARREAQPTMDSARAAFVARNAPATAKALRETAAFARDHADSAVIPARQTLLASADELDSLARRIEKGGTKALKSVTALDLAFARHHLAEAQLHRAHAADAWQRANTGTASSELVMLADHLERAAKDAGLPLPPSGLEATARARAVAAKLAQSAVVAPTEVEATFSAIDREVGALAAAVAKLKG